LNVFNNLFLEELMRLKLKCIQKGRNRGLEWSVANWKFVSKNISPTFVSYLARGCLYCKALHAKLFGNAKMFNTVAR
jgi:hypothetical protein